jgi:excisionase family DNA binding protein
LPTHNSDVRAPRWASIRTTAAHLDVHEKTVRNWIADGRLTGYRNGRLIRLDLNEVDAAMRQAV